jgi:hypothetical protein
MQQQQQMTPQARDGFEEGAGLVFSAWTALVLAVENEWGGQDSASKADAIIDDTIQWFYRKRGGCVDVAAAGCGQAVALCRWRQPAPAAATAATASNGSSSRATVASTPRHALSTMHVYACHNTNRAPRG